MARSELRLDPEDVRVWKRQSSEGARAWTRPGKIRPAVLLWALGVPLPLVLIFVLIRSCTT